MQCMLAMIVAVIIFVAIAMLLLVVIARFSPHPSLSRQLADPTRRDAKPRIGAARLYEVATALLASMGVRIEDSAVMERRGSYRLVGVARGVLREARHVIYVEAEPPGAQVGPETLLELAGDVAATGAAAGVLITPYHIDRKATAGMDEELELIDGLALRDLVHRHLPHMSEEIDRYELVGSRSVLAIPERRSLEVTLPEGPAPSGAEPHRVSVP